MKSRICWLLFSAYATGHKVADCMQCLQGLRVALLHHNIIASNFRAAFLKRVHFWLNFVRANVAIMRSKSGVQSETAIVFYSRFQVIFRALNGDSVLNLSKDQLHEQQQQIVTLFIFINRRPKEKIVFDNNQMLPRFRDSVKDLIAKRQ
ncbi:hypothetical protein BJ741DRAFT_603768 [Chytriomyces cf. hyalinus JEL632]|nr:hypothetical protein BJ741DRAFT_603768 [Chytriomyces cf. hyalinus JEL632]